MAELLRQPLQYLETAFERAQLAVRQARQPSFERGVGDRWAGNSLPALLGEPKRKATAVFRIRLAVDQAAADEHVDGTANRGCTAAHACSDFIQRCRFELAYRREKLPLLSERLGGSHVAAMKLDELCETIGKRRRCASPKHDCSLTNILSLAMLLLLNRRDRALRYRPAAAMTRQ
jgi:hypothetical protein